MNDHYHIMGSLKSMSSKRSKWYKCFKPDGEDYPFKPVSLGKGGRESMLRRDDLFDGDKLNSLSHGEHRLSKKSKPRRSFSRAFKAILFQSSLTKKKGSRKKSFQEPSNKYFNLFRHKKSSSSNKESSDDSSLRTDSSRSPLFSSSTTAASSSLPSSNASSIASNSRSVSERKGSCSIDLKQLNQKPTIYSKKTNGYCNSYVGLYFLLICLVALIFGGKAFAIFCTSTCLLLIPCRFKRVDDQSAVNSNLDSIDIDSDEYKKKVIMEGLLERNRTPQIL